MIALLITILIYAVIFSFAYYIIQLIPIAQPFKQWLVIAFLVICLIVLIEIVTGQIGLIHIGR